MRKVIAILGTLLIAITLYAYAPIEEDEPGWNCLLHGNHECGNVNDILGFIY